MGLNKRWLVAYVKMHHEKKVRDTLSVMGIENFLPVQTEVRQWSDRKKKVERILIPMMIFVRVDAEEQRQVIALPSVLRYLTLRGEHAPSVISDEQMNRFRFMLDNAGSSIAFNASDLQEGEQVRVTQGPLTGLTGELVTVDGKSSIAIRINQLGCAVVEVMAGWVEKVGNTSTREVSD